MIYSGRLLHRQKFAYGRLITGLGEFFFQPNGVLAWNHQWVFLSTTQQYVNQSLKAQYATQSGRMLVINHQFNSRFLADNSSYKIRNGIGLKEQVLYFVMALLHKDLKCKAPLIEPNLRRNLGKWST